MSDIRAPSPPSLLPPSSVGHFGNHQNYLMTLCDPHVVANSSGRVAQCAAASGAVAGAGVDVLCFTSADSCWSNNPTLLPRAWFAQKLRGWALESLEYFGSRSVYFELETTRDWVRWSPPARICASRLGLFRHHEVDQ